jgi:hypothetical protein
MEKFKVAFLIIAVLIAYFVLSTDDAKLIEQGLL